MPLTPAGLQRCLQLRHDAAEAVAHQLCALQGSVYAHWGACGFEACRQDLSIHWAFLRPVLEFDLPQPVAAYVAWLRELVAVRGIPLNELVLSLRGLADFCAPQLDAPNATVLRDTVQAVLSALQQAEPTAPETPEPAASPAEPAWPEAQDFEQALLRGQHPAAAQVVQQCLARGHSLLSIEAHVVQPAMVSIGEGWQANRVSVAQEHMATAIAHAVMVASMAQQTRPPSNQRCIVLACVQHNHHALGLRMVADAFELHGWDVIYLGANVPTDTLVDKVLADRPDVLGLSVSFAQQLSQVSQIIGALHRHLGAARPPVLVGGLAVNRLPPTSGLLSAVAYAASAQEAVAAAQRLLSGQSSVGRADVL
jgi:methanogenic corrinoid protein MtbC1